jgi:hypothetical protein
MSQHQQNWERIITELHKVVDQLDGPVDGCTWSEFGDETRDVFTAQIEEILEAELSHRVGDETRVNVKIKDALVVIGEQLVRGAASADGTIGKDATNV